jgi:hypothetical protein
VVRPPGFTHWPAASDGHATIELVCALRQVCADIGKPLAEVAEPVGPRCATEPVLNQPVELLFERLAQVPDAVKQPRVALDHDVNRGMFFRSRRKDSLGRGGRSQASACPFARLVAISHGIKVSGANQHSSCANGRMASGHYRRSSIASGCDA